MPKPHNNNLREKVLQYIKSKWMSNNQSPFKATLNEIALGIGLVDKNGRGKSELILNYVNELEDLEYIEVIRGGPSKSNQYIFKNDNITNHESIQFREQTVGYIHSIIQELNQSVGQLLQVVDSLTKEVIAKDGQLRPYKDALRGLVYYGESPDGSALFYANKETSPALKAIAENSHYQ